MRSYESRTPIQRLSSNGISAVGKRGVERGRRRHRGVVDLPAGNERAGLLLRLSCPPSARVRVCIAVISARRGGTRNIVAHLVR
jgi:hypothetical protein